MFVIEMTQIHVNTAQRFFFNTEDDARLQLNNIRDKIGNLPGLFGMNSDSGAKHHTITDMLGECVVSISAVACLRLIDQDKWRELQRVVGPHDADDEAWREALKVAARRKHELNEEK
jgi:hypothetical protein